MPPKDSLTVSDNEAKCFQHVRPEESEMEIEDEVDILIASDILATQMFTKNVTFSKSTIRMDIKEDKKETVGQYDSDIYTVNGLTLEQRKRREHLSRDDLQKNKVSIVEALTKAQPANIDPNEVAVRYSLLSNCLIDFFTDRVFIDSKKEFLTATSYSKYNLGRVYNI